MKVHTQFRINTLIFSMILCIVAFFVINSFIEIGFLNKQEDLARNIQLEASNLDYLWGSFIKNKNIEGNNWKDQFDGMTSDISKLKPDDYTSELIDRIQENQQSVAILLRDYALLASNDGQVPSQSVQKASEMMYEYTYGIITASSSLSQIQDHRSDDMTFLHSIWMLALLLVLGVFLITNYALVSRRILRLINSLVRGTRVVGAGDLDYSFEQSGKDELGELAQALNQMISNLKNMTASKQELEFEITERKKIEEELQQRSRELGSSNKELEAFTYSVSHDLRSPLRNISGFSSLLVKRYSQVLDAKGQEYLQYISESTQLMDQLLEDILGLYRVTHAELHMKNVDISMLAHQVQKELELGDPERTVSFTIKPNMAAFGDELLLKLVLQNLMGNAYKFTGKTDNPTIEVGNLARDGEKIFYVRDNGAGFDMEFAGKLFKPFSRLHSSTDFPGTGIGLASVQRIIQRHGGRAWAESEPNQGATFYFTLPDASIKQSG